MADGLHGTETLVGNRSDHVPRLSLRVGVHRGDGENRCGGDTGYLKPPQPFSAVALPRDGRQYLLEFVEVLHARVVVGETRILLQRAGFERVQQLQPIRLIGRAYSDPAIGSRKRLLRRIERVCTAHRGGWRSGCERNGRLPKRMYDTGFE